MPKPHFELGSTVYPKLDPCSDQGLVVTGHLYRPGGLLVYLVTNAEGDEKERYEFELTEELTYSTGGES